MLHITNISIEEKLTLEEMKKNHPCYLSRKRANAILLSNNGLKLQQICKALGVCRQTVAIWIRSWSAYGLCGLFDKPRTGRPCKITPNDFQLII